MTFHFLPYPLQLMGAYCLCTLINQRLANKTIFLEYTVFLLIPPVQSSSLSTAGIVRLFPRPAAWLFQAVPQPTPSHHQRYVFHQVGQRRYSHFNELVSCHNALCRCVLKINPYQVYQVLGNFYVQQAVEDFRVCRPCYKPSDCSFGQAQNI